MLPVATLPVYYCATLKWICVTCFLQYGMLHVKFVYSFSFKFLLLLLHILFFNQASIFFIWMQIDVTINTSIYLLSFEIEIETLTSIHS